MVACRTLPTYTLAVNWTNDSDYSDANEDVTADLLARVPIKVDYGRDQARALGPPRAGSMEYTLCNVDRLYSPENTASPIAANILPGRKTRLQPTHLSNTYTLFEGHIDDYEVHGDRANRSVDVTALDAMSRMRDVTLYTQLYTAIRTGTAIGHILDAVGWPAGARSIDPGATIMPYWWEDGADGFEALKKLLLAEGPPAMAYVDGGTFVFHDRHHRLVTTASLNSQMTLCVTGLGMAPCATGTPCAGGSIAYTEPFGYDHGLKNIINNVTFTVDERAGTDSGVTVWETEDVYTINASSTIAVSVKANDPFRDAIVPVAGTDYTVMAGSVTNLTLSRTSGQSLTMSITAGAGGATVAGLKLRATSLPVVRSYQVTATDATSQTTHGKHDYPEQTHFAGRQDAQAIADLIIAGYKDVRPRVTVRVVGYDDTVFTHLFTRKPGDRITIVNPEHGLNTTFYIEQITHEIRGLGKIHATTFGCEIVRQTSNTLFRFDVAGAGFNQGVFGQ